MGKIVDLTGQRFGMLTVVELAGWTSNKGTLWKVRCDCGAEKVTRNTHLRSGDSTSCGRCARVAGATRRWSQPGAREHARAMATGSYQSPETRARLVEAKRRVYASSAAVREALAAGRAKRWANKTTVARRPAAAERRAERRAAQDARRQLIAARARARAAADEARDVARENEWLHRNDGE